MYVHVKGKTKIFQLERECLCQLNIALRTHILNDEGVKWDNETPQIL
jgi:hypothetical protein